MFKKLFFFVLAIVLFCGFAGAQSASSKTIESQVKSYAEQYEAGQLNFLQFQVYINAIKDAVYQQFERPESNPENDEFGKALELLEESAIAFDSGNLNEANELLNEVENLLKNNDAKEEFALLQNLRRAIEEGDIKKADSFGKELTEKLKEGKRSFEFKGWTQEQVKEILGEPSFYDEWVWSENLKKDIRIEEKLPRWEKTIFSGKKIKVNLNANPSIREVESLIQAFYWIDISTSFVDEKKLETKGEIEKINSMVKQFYNGNGDKIEIAIEMAKLQRKVNDFLWKNKLQCVETMNELFEKASNDSEKIRWKGTLFSNENSEIFWNIDEFSNNEWHGFGTWIEIKSRENIPRIQSEQKPSYETIPNQKLLENLETEIVKAKQTGLSQNIWVLESNIRSLIDELTRRANQNDYEFSIGQFTVALEDLFSRQTKNFIKEKVQQRNYENLFVEDVQEVKDRWCEGKGEWCGENMSCVDAKCISSIGGNEICDNKIDDDKDRVIDCEDPDCIQFKQCGRICEPICGGKGKCWDCSEQYCKQSCNKCGECIDSSNQNNPECNPFCSECNSCQKTNCKTQCIECDKCQNQQYGDGCYDQCSECDDCRAIQGPNCEEQENCKNCNECRFRAGTFNCPPNHNFDQLQGNCIPIEQPQEQPPTEEQPQPLPTEQPSIPPIEEKKSTEVPISENPIEPIPAISVPAPENAPLPDSTTNPKEISTSILPFFEIGLPITGFVSMPSTTEIVENKCKNINCSVNQSCKPETGNCECQVGFFDCDGDWQNGCESMQQCKPCQSDNDCAMPRCEIDGFSIATFKCKEGETRNETRGKCSLIGTCGTKASGEKEADIHFECWGEKFNELNFEIEKQNSLMEGEYCKEELNNALKKRIEIQNSLNRNFVDWYFSEFVNKNPGKYKMQGESIRAIYEALMQVNEQIAQAKKCLNDGSWPSEATPVNILFESPNGKIKIWEELKQTNFWGFEQKILSPYMELWFFPTKEEFKQEFIQHFEEEGPSPREKALMQQNPEVMQKIKNMANRFGGNARILIEIKENNEFLMGMFLQINEKDLIDMSAVELKPENTSLTISIQYDSFYNMMSTIIKELEGARIEKPYWEQQEFEPPQINDLLVGIKMFLGISQGIVLGQIQVEPFWQIPNALGILGDMASLMQMA